MNIEVFKRNEDDKNEIWLISVNFFTDELFCKETFSRDFDHSDHLLEI